MDNKLISILFVSLFLFSISFTSAGSPKTEPFKCTIWDDVLDVFRQADCGSQFVGMVKQTTSLPYWKTLDARGNYTVDFKNKNSQKSELCFWHNTATKTQDLPNKLPIYNKEGKEIIQLNSKKDNTLNKVGYCRIVDTETYIKLNPTVVFQEDSTLSYLDIPSNLEVNNTIKKFNGLEYVTAPNDLFIVQHDNEIKFGANDSVATSDTNYVYEIKSNQEISKYKDNTYIVGTTPEGYKAINFDDVCTYKGCNFTIVNNTLNVYFVGKYNASLGGVLIDPTILTVSFTPQSGNLYNQTRWEGNSITHLQIDNTTLPYQNLTGYWSFDADSSTTSYDLSDYNNDGTFNGNAYANSTCSSIYIYGACFDGNGDYIRVADAPTLDNSPTMTYSVWVNFQEGGETQTIMYKHSSGGFGLSPNGIANIYWYASGGGKQADTTTNFSNNLNKWYMLTGVWNGTNSLIYVNGALESISTAGSGSIPNTGTTLDFGQYNNGQYFNGSLDEAMIFQTALNSTQIQELYNNQSKRFFTEGTVGLAPVGLNSSANTVNISLSNSQTNYGTSIQARAGYWNLNNGYNTSNSLALNLTGYWTGDGNANDLMGLNNGTLNGNANASSLGVYNSSFGLDGTGDYININGLPSGVNPNRTVSFWFKTSTIVGAHNIFTWDTTSSDHYGLYHDTTNLYFYIDGTNAVTVTGALATNTWYHATLTSIGTNNSLYLNGILKGSGTKIYTSDSDAYIGSNPAGGSAFNGFIDDVTIWNRSLSANEVKEVYNKGLANWNYTDWANLTNNNNMFILDNYQAEARAIRSEVKLFDGTNDGWYTPYVGEQTLLMYDFARINFIPLTSNGSQAEGSQIIYYNLSLENSNNATVNLFYSNGTLFTSNYLELTNLSGNFSGVPFGTWYINATTTSEGQTANTATNTIILNADLTNPLIEYVNPTDNGQTKAGNLLASTNASDNNYATTILRVYNSAHVLVYSNVSTNQLNYFSVNLPSGLYYFNATANDSYGNTNSTATRNVTIDNDVDNLVLVLPLQNNQYPSDNVLLNYTASDSSGINRTWYNVRYSSNGTNYTIIGNTTLTGNTTIPNLPIGSYFLNIYSDDIYGNLASVLDRFYQVTNISQGPPGQNGSQGPTGPEGPQGPQGPAGQNGTSTTIVVLCGEDVFGYYNPNLPSIKTYGCRRAGW